MSRCVLYDKKDNEANRKVLLEYCIRENIEIAGEFFDEGSRENFNKMLCFIREQQVEWLCIRHAGALTRKIDETQELIRAVSEAGIKKIILAESNSILDGHFLDMTAMDKLISEFSDVHLFNPMYCVKGNRVAIYHLSLDPIRSSCIDLQMDILRKYAEKKGWEVKKEYIELTSVEEKKTEIHKLLDDTEEFDIVLLKNAYYFSRRTPQFLALRNKLLDKGVRVYTLNEGWC